MKNVTKNLILMMRNYLLAFLGFSLCACQGSHTLNSSIVKDSKDGTNWCHAKFVGNNDSEMSVDYHVDYNAPNYRAKPLWINLTRPNLSENDSARVVVVEQTFDTRGGPGSYWTQGNTYINDMKFDQELKKFTFEFKEGLPILTSNMNGQAGYIYEFAFVVNGEWIKDGAVNFKANLYDIHAKSAYSCYAR